MSWRSTTRSRETARDLGYEHCQEWVVTAARARGLIDRGRLARHRLPLGKRYFKGKDPSDLPAPNNALRRLRSTCAN